MTNLRDEDVRHIASLARLQLQEDEVPAYAKDMRDILEFVAQLQEVDTTGVSPTAQATGLCNATRTDEIERSAQATPDELLDCSPLPTVEHQIQTPSTHES